MTRKTRADQQASDTPQESQDTPVQGTVQGQDAQQESASKPAPGPQDTPVSVRTFVEENPALTREARDILTRLHLRERKTREDWQALAQTYGGNR